MTIAARKRLAKERESHPTMAFTLDALQHRATSTLD